MGSDINSGQIGSRKCRPASSSGPAPQRQSNRFLALGVYLAICIAATTISMIQRCQTQKPITLNNHQVSHQYNSTQLKHQMTTNQQQQQQQPSLYQNFSLSSNRPLERPRLNLVSNVKGSSSSSSADAPPEGAADWFILGGGHDDLMTEEAKHSSSFVSHKEAVTKRTDQIKRKKSGGGGGSGSSSSSSSNKTVFDDDSQSDSSDSNEIFDDVEDNGTNLAGTQKEPDCAAHGRYYCTYKEDYPLKLVTEVTKYYKWPLEKLFRDLHAQIMPKLAQDSTGNLVCDSITRVVRPGWARNTNERWLVVINTDNYHQYVTEVVCQYGTNSRCNFIPPCYYSSCQQRYNTQKLLVIDPNNPYRGPFLSEFLFPSCCVCYVPSSSESFKDSYRPSPATIYQKTMQQEAAANVHPPQFRPPGIIEEPASSNQVADQSSISSSRTQANGKTNQPAGIGEIRRGGDQYRSVATGSEFNDFPRLGLADSLLSQKMSKDTSPEVRQ